ncbi:asparagine synthase (glutamine-hydrolysing) [Herbihabitans rhizosphaerae]|uniref:asparagine synthase (glutamine-hydrolyzing) n=1 Tax=Herbihabitans rhizosphaerae TaxID=1872711 RepID=A0A4Q7KGJ6_9PSEU|nr:asparagine synthase-related protein [Herbihabitans rhizosphaerae]RZS33978.1 asparagine synthase (glutamine-hydrolysing) [Herbihabitans rhizosphaerae]
MEFIVLPDHPEAWDALRDRPELAGARTVGHPSGRPWLVGWWREDDLALVTAPDRRLALIGRTTLDPDEAARALRRARTPHDLDAYARRTVGSVHLVASLDGQVRAQGTVSTARQLFTARIDGRTVAASNPGLLAELTESQLDERALAVRLLVPQVPWPLSAGCVWSGVEPLAAGSWLHLDRAGAAHQIRWWRPPVSDRPLAEAAGAVRNALTDAITARVAGRGTVSADLSGGLDSTALCFLADAEGADLLTYHVTPLDRANDDTAFAERAAAMMPRARHHTIPAQRPASWFDVDPERYRAADTGEGPPVWGAGLAHLAELSETAASAGSTLHLMGIGGDELFGAMPAYLWSLIRHDPLRSLPVIHRYRLHNRWRLDAVVRGLADRTHFAGALARAARELTAPLPRPPALQLGWTGGSRMPGWATPHAVDLVREAFTAAARAGTEPLDADRVRHQVLEYLMYEGTLIRQTRRAMAASGVEWDAPFLDDRVIEAALSVRIQDRVRRGRYKPVLVESLRGAVPDDVLDRRTKGEFSAEMYQGMSRNREKFLALCDDLRLADLGLVDPAALRSALHGPSPESRHLAPFENTVACESWLRGSASPARQPAGGSR